MFTADDFDLTGYDAVQLTFVCDHRLVLVSRYPKLVVALFHAPRFVGWMKQNDTMRSATYDTSTLVACIVEAVQRYTTDYQGQLNRQRVDSNDHALWKVVRQSCTLRANTSPMTTAEGAERNTTEAQGEQHLQPLRAQTSTITTYDNGNATTPQDRVGGGERRATNKSPSCDTNADDNPVRDNHEASVLQRVHKTLKPYHYWKDTSMPMVEIDVRAPVHQPHLYQQYRRRTRRKSLPPQPSQPSPQDASISHSENITHANTSPPVPQHQSRVISL